ncbi:terminase family protein [Methylobacterium sp. WL12]|uniref:terminase large subunit domain-containing protein n=1 Tax=Methylobacterium sp. WL12 TaxID=2603890 RepID=UPI00164F6C5E|nr:terminase family protein [Methylobacterium sp. WL12]
MAGTALPTPSASALDWTEFQTRVLSVPQEWDLFIGGGRGGGKTFGLAGLILRHIEEHGAAARVLFVRRNFTGMQDFEATCRQVFGLAYQGGASYNGSSHLWTFPSGATLQLDQYEGDQDFYKYQGKSFTMIAVDEAGQYSDPAMLDMLRSCLRAPAPILPRFVVVANPGGPGHGWLSRRHVNKATPWHPYLEKTSGRTFVNCPSTYHDNPNLDREAYAKQLDAATSLDPDLGKAWKFGDWSIGRGAYFSSVLDEQRVMIDGWALPSDRRERDADEVPPGFVRVGPKSIKLTDQKLAYLGRLSGQGFKFFLAHDYGSTSPSVTYVCAESPGAVGADGRFYARGSILLLDELATVEPNTLNKGLGYTIPHLCEAITDLAKRWNIPAKGVGDDSMFSFGGSAKGSYADEFRSNGVSLQPARKGRRKPGWALMRTMLQDAGKPDRAGLYVARRCEYWWLTVPSLGRDPRDFDDVDSRGPDHAADACRYALTRGNFEVRSSAISGLY